MLKVTTLWLVILFTSLSWGISKIGGSSINSPNNGFSLKIPSNFLNPQPISEDRIRLVGPMTIAKGNFTSQFVDVDSFADIYPTLGSLNRSDWMNYFVQKNGIPQTNNDPCIVAYRFGTSSAVSIIASWGQGKGIVLMSVNTLDGTQALQQMYDSLKIDANACSW